MSIDRAETIEALETLPWPIRSDMRQAIIDALELLRAIPEWISVEDSGLPELPENRTKFDCLVWLDGDWDVVPFWDDSRVDRLWQRVTHYQILDIPPPPEQS